LFKQLIFIAYINYFIKANLLGVLAASFLFKDFLLPLVQFASLQEVKTETNRTLNIKKGKIALSAFLPQYFFTKRMETETT
jgi:hypothetical protein